MVETTPLVFKSKVYRCEWVRKSYKGNELGDNYFRLVDISTGNSTRPFARGYVFASAFVDDDAVYVTGTSTEAGWTGQRIEMFVSRDLRDWKNWTALDLDGFGICNTSICKADDRYVMMFEIHKPKEQAGAAFTARFATSKDLRNWELTEPQCVYAKDRYTAPHCLRYLDGYFYNFYLEAHNGYEMRVVRSKDLVGWEPSPLNPVLRASDDDKLIANQELTAEQRRRIANATNINNSDIDFCQHQGRLIINYSWGNQKGTEFLAEAVYDGTVEQFLSGWFPKVSPDLYP
jgi:beta-xylosidase